MNVEKYLNKTQNEYSERLKKVEEYLKNKVEFNFFLTYQESDSTFVLTNDINNTPIHQCLEIIKEKGILSYKDYLSNSI